MARLGDVCEKKVDTIKATYKGDIDYIDLSKSEFETVLSGSECVRRPVEDAVLWTLRLESLQKAMEVLDHQSREFIDFRYDRGLTMEEIGKFYGVSKMAVSKRLRKLHQKLKGSVI